DRVIEAIVLDLDRRALNAQVLADEWAAGLHRTAERPREDRAELLDLLVRCGLVHDHAEAPVALAHDLRGLGDGHDLLAAHVDALDLALVDIEHERHAAIVIGGAERERGRAWTDHVARTALEVGPLDIPGHLASSASVDGAAVSCTAGRLSSCGARPELRPGPRGAP